MGDTKTIDLSYDAAKALLPVLERHLGSLFETMEGAIAEHDKVEKTINEIRAKLSNGTLPGIEDERKRKRKGEAEKQIGDLLTLGGSYTIQEISKRTNTPYSTVFRILKIKGRGRFVEENDKWKAVK